MAKKKYVAGHNNPCDRSQHTLSTRHPKPPHGGTTQKGSGAMRKSICLMVVTGLLTMGGVAACGDDSGGGTTKTPKIGVILPDSASSARWETADRKYLEEAFNLDLPKRTKRALKAYRRSMPKRKEPADDRLQMSADRPPTPTSHSVS